MANVICYLLCLYMKCYFTIMKYGFYKFKIAGLLIKNQLVTHLTLGIALRAVLDALRKPADSKVSTNFW